MYRKEVNERSPMRVFEKSMHGGLGRGNVGVVAARHGVGRLERRGRGEIEEDLVVVRAHVIDRVLVRDVEHPAIAHQIVERDLHEQRRLADAVARGDDTDVAAAEPAVHRFLEDPHRAPLVHFLAIHGEPLTSPSSAALRGTS